jgi:hypothetical protein
MRTRAGPGPALAVNEQAHRPARPSLQSCAHSPPSVSRNLKAHRASRTLSSRWDPARRFNLPRAGIDEHRCCESKSARPQHRLGMLVSRESPLAQSCDAQRPRRIGAPVVDATAPSTPRTLRTCGALALMGLVSGPDRGRIGRCQEPPAGTSEAVPRAVRECGHQPNLLAGRSGSMWDGKDPVASIAEYLCCSEGMWRNRVESRGNGVGLLTTQRSRVQIPPPPPLLSRAFALHLLLGESLRGLLLAEGSGTTVPDPFCVPPRIRSATVAASLCMPGMTWP